VGLFYFGAVGHFRIGASIRIFFVDADEFDQALNAIVGERFDAMFSNAIDPDHAVLDLHFNGDITQPVCKALQLT